MEVGIVEGVYNITWLIFNVKSSSSFIFACNPSLQSGIATYGNLCECCLGKPKKTFSGGCGVGGVAESGKQPLSGKPRIWAI